MRQRAATGNLTARLWIVDTTLLTARLTARACPVWGNAEIQAQIPAWQGCDAELAALGDDPRTLRCAGWVVRSGGVASTHRVFQCLSDALHRHRDAPAMPRHADGATERVAGWE